MISDDFTAAARASRGLRGNQTCALNPIQSGWWAIPEPLDELVASVRSASLRIGKVGPVTARQLAIPLVIRVIRRRGSADFVPSMPRSQVAEEGVR